MVWYGKGVYKTLNGIMCKASTKITSVQVDYSSSINTTVRSVTARVPNGPADLFGRYTLYNLVQAQTMVGNTVGENMIQLGGSAEKQDGEDTLRAMVSVVQLENNRVIIFTPPGSRRNICAAL
jgi:hypothetical protein